MKDKERVRVIIPPPPQVTKLGGVYWNEVVLCVQLSLFVLRAQEFSVGTKRQDHLLRQFGSINALGQEKITPFLTQFFSIPPDFQAP